MSLNYYDAEMEGYRLFSYFHAKYQYACYKCSYSLEIRCKSQREAGKTTRNLFLNIYFTTRRESLYLLGSGMNEVASSQKLLTHGILVAESPKVRL